jgi:hypothetical protein
MPLKKSTKTRLKLKSLSSLKKKAWKIQSLFFRKAACIDGTDYLRCFTCRAVTHYKEAHLGHYIHNKLDFDERNLKPQCERCNYYLSGNLGVYGERLVREHGQNWLDQLRAKAQVNGNYYTRQDLEKIIQKYG